LKISGIKSQGVWKDKKGIEIQKSDVGGYEVVLEMKGIEKERVQ